MIKKDNVRVCYTRLDKSTVDTFDRLYPDMRSRFISRALAYANQSKDFVMQILFGELPCA